jgi:hypothetical protein
LTQTGVRDRSGGNERYKSIASQKFGPKSEFLFNEKRTAVLCLNTPTPTSAQPKHHIRFFAFDLSSDSTIFEDEIVDGSVVWKDNFRVLVMSVPGMVKRDDPPGANKSGYIFDLRSRKTHSLDAVDIE